MIKTQLNLESVFVKPDELISVTQKTELNSGLFKWCFDFSCDLRFF